MVESKKGILIILQFVLIIFIFSLWFINSSISTEQNNTSIKNEVKLESIEFPSFSLGNVNTISVSAYNYLENDVFDVLADFSITNQDNMTVSMSNTEIPIMKSNSSIKLNTNWDTKNINSGNYTIQVKLTYNEKTKEKDYFVSVGPSSVYLFNSLESNPVVHEIKKKSSFSITLMVIAILLVMIDVYVTFYIIKKQ